MKLSELFMRRSKCWCVTLISVGVAALVVTSIAAGQAVTPAEIKNPRLRELQEKYLHELQAAGAEVQGHIFPFPFYFSRILDLELAQQERADQRSLRFDEFGGMTVVELTGNYFGSYSTELVNKGHRAVRTFQDVMLPILEIVVPAFRDNPDVQGFAMEISHHIRGKTMGQSMERPENLVLALSKDAAVRLVTAKNENDRQAAILDGQFFFNGEPFILYLSDEAAQEAAKRLDKVEADAAAKDAGKASVSSASTATSRNPSRSSVAAAPPRDTSPEALAKIQAAQQKMIDLVARELEPQAHFVSYSPPAVVAFRKAAYLEFSVNTTLAVGTPGSRYKMAALAFDDHIAHLVRPMMAYFKGDLDFDGIAFSTTIHVEQPQPSDPTPQKSQAGRSSKEKADDKTQPTVPQGQAANAQASEAVEFFFPVEALRCYEAYDCTGQQLIDQGAVLINGERVGLDLQIAEGGGR